MTLSPPASQKVTNVVMKELEVLARREIKEETAHLETLLSVLSTTDEVRVASLCRNPDLL